MKMNREMKTKMKMRNNKVDKKDKNKRYLKKIRDNNLNKYKEKIQNRVNRLSLMQ